MFAEKIFPLSMYTRTMIFFNGWDSRYVSKSFQFCSRNKRINSFHAFVNNYLLTISKFWVIVRSKEKEWNEMK